MTSCKYCGGDKKPSCKYCSLICAYADRGPIKKYKDIVCQNCGVSFSVMPSSSVKYCCHSCSVKHRVQKKADNAVYKPCPVCHKKFKVTTRRITYCSVYCANNSPIRTAKTKQTIIDTYGSTEIFYKKALQLRIKTSLQKYGFDNPAKSDIIKRKMRDVSMERYGYANPSQHPDIRDKIALALSYSDFDRSAHAKKQYQLRLASNKKLAGCLDKNKRDATYLEKYGSLGLSINYEMLKAKYGWSDLALSELSKIRTQTQDNFIRRYGKIEGTKKWEAYKKSTSCSLENCIRRHGEKKGLTVYNNIRKHLLTVVAPRRASKESLIIFLPLAKFCLKLGLHKKDIYFGYQSSQEYWLSIKGGEYYSYDFCIPKLKLILEYHGEHVHPNNNMSAEDWGNWMCPFTKKDADFVYAKDQRKGKVAVRKGFTYVSIWSSSDKGLVLKKAKYLVKEKLNDFKHQQS